MRRMKNKKLKSILSLSGYFLLIIALCFVGAFVFHSYYYESVYVSGNSMAPTLLGADEDKDGAVVDFGIVDAHSSAINNIKRFDIVSTYFPDDYDSNGNLALTAKKKIKRVVGMPGDTFTIEDGVLRVKNGEDYVEVPYTFNVEKTKAKDTIDGPITLLEDEYWLLGDNRNNSTDCAKIGKPVTKKNIVGVLVAIEGRAKLKLKKMVCPACGSTYSSGSICNKCSTQLRAEFDLVNKVYKWPKYY